MLQLSRRSGSCFAGNAAKDLTHVVARDKVEALIKASDVSEAEAQRLAKPDPDDAD